MRLAFLLAAPLFFLLPAMAQESDAPPGPIEVMVLGTYHMGNPGLDVVNMEAEDVTSQRRQVELEALAESIARFAPTVIAVETVSAEDDLSDPRYEAFTPEQLTTSRNEITQIGYRLAAKLGHEKVYGVDAQDGEIDFFPFDEVRAFEETHGPEGKIAGLVAGVQQMAAEFEAMQADNTISELLAWYNDAERDERMHQQFYYSLLEYADSEDQPGARLNYGWYARNALIFAKITQVAEPGDRVLVIYGAGHKYWLRHFAENTPGYDFIDPVAYLR